MRRRRRVTAGLVVVAVVGPAATAWSAWSDTARLAGGPTVAFVVAAPALSCTPASPQTAATAVVRWEARRAPGSTVVYLDHAVTVSSGPDPGVVVGPGASRRVDLAAPTYGAGLARGASRQVVVRVEARLPGVAAWATSAEVAVTVMRTRTGMDRTTATCS